ncbi:MAG: hypothetical protein ACTSX4_12435, partial [Candidatus Helarchaeota archaeon]
LEKIPEIKEKFQDIFTREIDDDDPLWRVRAYVIGLLLADGNIYKKKVSLSQHPKDYDLVEIIHKSLGGSVKFTKREMYRFSRYSESVVNSLKQFGMIRAHSKEEISTRLELPSFVEMKIENSSLVKDFVRGFYDGDGWFVSTTSNVYMFCLNASEYFLENLKKLILNEIPNLSYHIYPSYRKVFIRDNQKYFVYKSKVIYIPKMGYYELSEKDLEEGEIKKEPHPWLKELHIAGRYNCIKFFNWLYDNDDKFYQYTINGIRLCGKRKFKKAINSLGKEEERNVALAPNWKDALYTVINLMECKFYTSKELLELTNSKLAEILKALKLEKLYSKNKIDYVSDFNRELKKIEILEGLIIRFQTRVKSSNVNYYYSKKFKADIQIPQNFKQRIDLIDRNKIVKKNLKNLIIFIFLKNTKLMEFSEILVNLENLNVFSLSTLRPNRVLLEISELKCFDILIEDDNYKEVENQKFFLNLKKLPYYFERELQSIINELNNTFK